MNDEQVRLHFQTIRERLAVLRSQNIDVWREIDAALEDLHVIYEEMCTNLETAVNKDIDLFQQNQQLISAYQQQIAAERHYQNLFQSLPIAYFVIDIQWSYFRSKSGDRPSPECAPALLSGKAPLPIYCR